MFVFVVVVGVFGVWWLWVFLLLLVLVGVGVEGGNGVVFVIVLVLLVFFEYFRVFVFGDFWMYGFVVDEFMFGYVYVLVDLFDGEMIVDGVCGSGYLKLGIDGLIFGECIVVFDFVLVFDFVFI